jgi:hypothetical protein
MISAADTVYPEASPSAHACTADYASGRRPVCLFAFTFFLVAEWARCVPSIILFFLIFKLAAFYFTIGQVRSQSKKTLYKGREGINPNLVITRTNVSEQVHVQLNYKVKLIRNS